MNQRLEKLNSLKIFYESFWNLESPRIFFPYAQRLVLVYARRSMKSANYNIELQCHVVRYDKPNVGMFNSLFSSVSRIIECLVCHLSSSAIPGRSPNWRDNLWTGAGQKTPEIFVSGSSNKKWRHIRFKLGRAARFDLARFSSISNWG